MGAQVIIVGRSEQRCRTVLQEINGYENDFILTDLSEMDQVRRAVAEFSNRFQQLDVLINNAGGAFLKRQVTSQGCEMTWALNHLSYFLLTNLLIPKLEAAAAYSGEARVVVVSSAAHEGIKIEFDNLNGERSYNLWKAYKQSKLANILFSFELARRMGDNGICVNALHPGFVATRIGDNNGWLARFIMRFVHLRALSLEQGAQTPVYLASSPEVEGKSGLYYVNCKPIQADPAAYDINTARQLWEISTRMSGLNHLNP